MLLERFIKWYYKYLVFVYLDIKVILLRIIKFLVVELR